MKLIQVYDPPMCCSSGICGPEVDPRLVRFAADLKWLGEQGMAVERYNLSQSPKAFAENDTVRAALTESGEAALPLILVDGKPVSRGSYPTRENLADLLGLPPIAPSLFTPAVAELVAISAAVASNCEPCLRYHAHEAEKLGVSLADVTRAVELAAKIKDAPHQTVLRLAARLTAANAPEDCGCCGSDDDEPSESGSKCCN